MNKSALILSHDVKSRIADSLSRGDERRGGNNHREDGHKLAATSNAIVDTDTSSARVLDLADLADEKFGHDKRIENIAASHHQSSSLCNDDDHLTLRGTVTNIIDAQIENRFRAAPCAVPEHSTYYTTAHRLVAAHSFNAGRVG